MLAHAGQLIGTRQRLHRHIIQSLIGAGTARFALLTRLLLCLLALCRSLKLLLAIFIYLLIRYLLISYSQWCMRR